MSWRLNDENGPACGLRREHDSLPGQSLRVQLPRQAELLGLGRQRVPGAGSMAAGFPAPALLDIPQNGIIPVSGSLQNSTFDVIPDRPARRHAAFVERRLQRQLPFILTADIAYVGNRGVDLVMDVDRNASLVYDSGNIGRPQFAPFNRTGTSRTRTNDNKSQYHGLQMKIDRRFRKGLLIMNSYTFSRARNYVNENTAIGTPIDFDRAGRASDFDRLHNYVLTAIYELPWGPGKRWMSDGLSARSSAAGRSAVCSSRSPAAAHHHRQRHAAQYAGQHRLRRSQRGEHGARRPRPRQAVFRSDRLHAAGRRRAGQHEPQQRSGRPRLLAARRVAVQAVHDRRHELSPSSASTRST